MKILMTVLALALMSVNAFAANTLVCENQDGKKIEWTAEYGEFVVTDNTGVEIANIDGLNLGETKFYETLPAKTKTAILYGDEAMDQVLAYIEVVEGGNTSIKYKKETYLCK